jgi:holo-[acyl-carrier protein] synthase
VIVGIGIDLVSASRIKRILDQSWGNRFVTRVFGPEEISYCRSGPKPEEAFAARFAAKEAMAKALGTGFSEGVTPAQIIVRGGDRQKPSIALSSVAGKIAESMGISNLNVSLSHSDGMACAIVIAEKI